MSKTSSPLRYPGGKHFLADFFEEVLDENELTGCTYVEPFAGGAGAGLSLLYRECVSRLWINDASHFIYCFWHSLINQPKDILDRVENCDISLDTRDRCIYVIKNPNLFKDLDVGFSAFFLNRVNRGGILTAGPIGGYEQNGKWRIDARFNKNNLIDRLEMVSTYADRIIVTKLDGVDLLKSHLDTTDAFVYIDPPYFKQGKRLYHNDFSIEKHRELASFLQKPGLSNWIVTYDHAPEARNLYKGLRSNVEQIKYSVSSHQDGDEIFIYSNNLRLPIGFNERLRRSSQRFRHTHL